MSAEQKRQFLEALAETGRMGKAREAAKVSAYAVSKARETDAQFEADIQANQETAIEGQFERLDDALEIYPNPQQAKVFSDNLKWKLAKLRPERFGDRLDLKTTLTIDLTDRFARAVERLAADRLRPMRDLAEIEEAETLELEPISSTITADSETDHIALPLADRLTGDAEGEDERAVSSGRGVAGGGHQNAERSDVLPPLQPDRGGANPKDYAPVQGRLQDGH